MEQLLQDSMSVLDRARTVIPTVQLKTCAGLLLCNAHQAGLGASYSAGAGVLLSHLDGKWSAPVAISMGSVGIGAVLGFANTQVAIVLNPLAMRSLIESPHGSLKFGGNLSLTMGGMNSGCGGGTGGTGGGLGADVNVGDGGKGWASSIVYTFSNGPGLMITAQLETGSVKFLQDVNAKFYDTSDASEILEGLASTPPGPAAHLVDRLTTLTTTTTTTTTATSSTTGGDSSGDKDEE